MFAVAARDRGARAGRRIVATLQLERAADLVLAITATTELAAADQARSDSTATVDVPDLVALSAS